MVVKSFSTTFKHVRSNEIYYCANIRVYWSP